MRALLIETGELAGRRVEVEGELIVGRAAAGAGLVIADQRLSRRHARFYIQEGELWVEDLGSPNGTIVNQQRVTHQRLVPGDTIVLGKTQMVVLGASASSAPPRPPVRPSTPAGVPAAPGPKPRLIKPMPAREGHGLEQMPAEDFFRSLGIGEQTLLDARAEAFEVVFRRARSYAVLHEIGRVVQRERDPVQMLERALDVALKVTRADRGCVVLLDEDRRPKVEVARGPHPGGRPVVSHTITEHVLGGQNAVLCADLSTDARFQDAPSLMLSAARTWMAAPLRVRDTALGFIQVERLHAAWEAEARASGDGAFTEDDLDLVSMIASTIAVAFDNLQLARQREETIHELEKAQEQLLSAQERLIKSEQLAAIGRFAAGIAHEVKNHLSPFALADMLAEKYPDDSMIRDSAEMMIEAHRHILDLVNEIGVFARGDASSLERSPHDLGEVVEAVIRFMRCDRAFARAEISVEHESRPVADLDARSFRQVLINLLRNALHALPDKGGRIRVVVREEGARAIVEVIDNGCGIPEDVAARIFEPFFSTKGDRGLGLGLDISRKIVVGHGGELTFTSAIGKGTTFRVSLPPADLAPTRP